MKIKMTRELIEKLPKTDLHVHLDGSLRISTLIELAKEQNIQLPTTDPDEMRKLIVCGEHTSSLEEYLRGFPIVNLVLQTKDSLRRALMNWRKTPPGKTCATWKCAIPPSCTPTGGSS